MSPRDEDDRSVEMIALLCMLLLAAILGVVAADWATGDRDIRDRIHAERCK